MASKREGAWANGDRRIWKLHEAAPVGEGSGARGGTKLLAPPRRSQFL